MPGCSMSSHRHSALSDYNPWGRRTRAPPRPRDFESKTPPPRKPLTPSEILVDALEDGMAIVGALRSDNPLKNVTISIQACETPGATDGVFQDPPTWRLLLTLEDMLFRRRQTTTLDEFSGNNDVHYAPTWCTLLTSSAYPSRSAQFVREYAWMLNLFSYIVLKPGILDDRDYPVWRDIMNFVWDIKLAFEKDYGRTPQRNLETHSLITTLAQSMTKLALCAEDESGGDADYQGE